MLPRFTALIFIFDKILDNNPIIVKKLSICRKIGKNVLFVSLVPFSAAAPGDQWQHSLTLS